MKLERDWLEFLCCVNAVADPGEVPGATLLVILRLGSPLISGSGWPPPPPPHLKVWVQHWHLVCVVLVNTWSHCWPKNVGRCCVRLHVVALECSVFCRIAIWVCFGEAVASFIGYHEVARESSSKQSYSLSSTQNRRPSHWSRYHKEFGGELWQSRPQRPRSFLLRSDRRERAAT